MSRRASPVERMMFKVGDKVRLVRHDQYPTLVGVEGRVTRSDPVDPSHGSSYAVAEAGARVYQVACDTRTLHDVPEAWIVPAGRKRRDP